MQQIFNTGLHNNITMPLQTISESEKDERWLKKTVEFLYFKAISQIRRNSVFSDIKKMTQGDFVYRSVDINSTLNPDMMEDKRLLTKDVAMPTHLKHFDFLGIISNAIKGMFLKTNPKYNTESIDEYFTNDYIRERTQRLEVYAAKLFEVEINKMLISKGLNPNQTDFKSEQEQQQYTQQLEAEIKKFTPDEIQQDMSKNFKVKALEWSNNVLSADKKKFDLETKDGDRLIDFILTGRWFRHYKVGYDYYDIEDWAVERVFFEETESTKYPQDSGYIGRIVKMSISEALMKFGHHLTSKQQTDLGDFWGNNNNYLGNYGVDPQTGLPISENQIQPFHNYNDHNYNLMMEEALGIPLAMTTREDSDGNSYIENDWIPRLASPSAVASGSSVTGSIRNDILTSNANVEVMEAYWTSFEKFGVLIYENEVGQLAIENTTEELIKDFIKEFKIKVKTNISLSELQKALNSGRIEDYKNTLTWHYKPQSRYVAVIKTNKSLNIKDDIIISGEPILQQIKGDSNIYQVRHPVGGLITNSIIKKVFPYQQMHNICMNQMSELLADELGVFYSFDVNALASEYKGETTSESVDNATDGIRRNRMLPLDGGRVNTQNNTTQPNLFQVNEVSFANQIQYRQVLAEYFQRKGYEQVGVTPQMLGAPTTYETKEGVQQQAQASYALISNIIDEFNTSKAKSNELHIAIAQQCEVNGKVSNRMFKNSDGANIFIDILAEDPDYFPLRNIGISAEGAASDRTVLEGLQQMLLADNTIQKDFQDLAKIKMASSALAVLNISKEMRKNSEKKIQDQRVFESEQTDKQIAAQNEKEQTIQKNQIEGINLKGEWAYKVAFLTSLGRDSASTPVDDSAQLTKSFQDNLKSKAINADIDFKNRDMIRKESVDQTNKSLQEKKIELGYAQIQAKDRQDETKKYVATINPG